MSRSEIDLCLERALQQCDAASPAMPAKRCLSVREIEARVGPALVGDLLTTCAEDLQCQLAALWALHRIEDEEAMQEVLLSFREASAVIGADRLLRASEVVAQCLQAGDKSALATGMHALRHEVSELVPILEARAKIRRA